MRSEIDYLAWLRYISGCQRQAEQSLSCVRCLVSPRLIFPILYIFLARIYGLEILHLILEIHTSLPVRRGLLAHSSSLSFSLSLSLVSLGQLCLELRVRDSSRARKIKCDGARPVCATCVRRKSTKCVYDEVPKRRGPDRRPRRLGSKAIGGGSSTAPPSAPRPLNRGGTGAGPSSSSNIGASSSQLGNGAGGNLSASDDPQSLHRSAAGGSSPVLPRAPRQPYRQRSGSSSLSPFEPTSSTSFHVPSNSSADNVSYPDPVVYSSFSFYFLRVP